MSKHYIRLNPKNQIIKGFSTDFESPLETDICINEDGQRHFELDGVVNPSLMDNNSCHKYIYENEVIREATEEEIQAELMEHEANKQPSETKLLMLALAELDAQREADKIANQIAMAEMAELLLGGKV